MEFDRRSAADPRTVARCIPGFFDALFPQLAPAFVSHLNKTAVRVDDCIPISPELVSASGLQPAMLFEIAVAAGDQLLAGAQSIDWDESFRVALLRQRRHFDAQLPECLALEDISIAAQLSKNLVKMMSALRESLPHGSVAMSPVIPGYHWISSGVGDYSVGQCLIEVKCTNKHFSSSDYRQIIMYWLLSYAAAVEGGPPEWSTGVLLNPRLNLMVSFSFTEIIRNVGAGRSKVDILELFSSIVCGRANPMLEAEL